jgi:anti-sigma regulatory factor (Ser/Thr protein kinase)
MTHPAARSEGVLLQRTVANRQQISEAREEIVRAIGDRLDESIREDVRIVASELLTNAVEHGTGQVAPSVELRSDGRTFSFTVTNELDDAGPPPPQEWHVPEPLALRGRGLGIVASLAPRVAVERSGRELSITCGWPTRSSQAR